MSSYQLILWHLLDLNAVFEGKYSKYLEQSTRIQQSNGICFKTRFKAAIQYSVTKYIYKVFSPTVYSTY